jgi:DNA replication and repair protein RecF
VQHGATAFHLRGEVESDRRTSLEVSWVDGGRVRTVNGKATPLADHLGVLPVVAWTTAEAEVLTGTPKARRKLLDRGILGIRTSALDVLGRYREALRQKRGLLLSGEPGIEIWNELLASLAADVIALRHTYVERLRVELDAVLQAAGLPFPPVSVTYRPSPPSGVEGAAAVAASLEKVADRERRRQLPLVGPHRDELEILWEGHEVRRVASAGERKALSLLLLAAHGRVLEAAGRKPLYLLDDADAELAVPTLGAVWKVFAGQVATGGQLIATSNRPQVWLTQDVGRIWEMERGRLIVLEE